MSICQTGSLSTEILQPGGIPDVDDDHDDDGDGDGDDDDDHDDGDGDHDDDDQSRHVYDASTRKPEIQPTSSQLCN